MAAAFGFPRLAGVWEWYRIGLAAGIGAGAGLAAAGWVARTKAGAPFAMLAGAAVGVAVGFALPDEWKDAVGGAAGGLLGGFGGASLAGGTLRRGGTRARTGILIG